MCVSYSIINKNEDAKRRQVERGKRVQTAKREREGETCKFLDL